MEYGGWKLARAADRPSPLPRDANDPANFPIVPYHREDLIPRWRLINDRRLITMARAAEAIQSAATSIFRAGSLTVGASSILERLNEFIGNRWMESLSVLRYSFHRATIIARLFPGCLFIGWYPVSLQNARDWSVFLFFDGMRRFICARNTSDIVVD